MRFPLDVLAKAHQLDDGFCLVCGHKHYNKEPDAEGDKCDNCGEHQVAGAAQIAILGHVKEAA